MKPRTSRPPQPLCRVRPLLERGVNDGEQPSGTRHPPATHARRRPSRSPRRKRIPGGNKRNIHSNPGRPRRGRPCPPATATPPSASVTTDPQFRRPGAKGPGSARSPLSREARTRFRRPRPRKLPAGFGSPRRPEAGQTAAARPSGAWPTHPARRRSPGRLGNGAPCAPVAGTTM